MIAAVLLRRLDRCFSSVCAAAAGVCDSSIDAMRFDSNCLERSEHSVAAPIRLVMDQRDWVLSGCPDVRNQSGMDRRWMVVHCG